MQSILLLEKDPSSPIETIVSKLGYRVSRSEQPPDDPTMKPQLIIHDEEYPLPQAVADLKIPEILVLKDYRRDFINDWLGILHYGFLLRPVNEASVITLVENATGKRGIHYKTVIDSLRMPFYVLDARTYEIVLSNKEAKRLGKGNEHTCHELSHGSSKPCSGEDHECPLKRVIETKMPFSTEHVHSTADGEKRYVEVGGYPILNKQLEVSHMIEYSIDISRQKHEEQQVKKLTHAIDRSLNIILIIDNAGKIEFVNNAFEKKLAIPKNAVYGNTICEIERYEAGKGFYRILQEAVHTGKRVHGEFSYLMEDGNPSWEYVTVTPIRKKGSVESFIAVCENIGNQVRRREELERAKEEATKASAMKSQFLANISHEIRTPLNIILGFTDLLHEEETDEKKQQRLSNIQLAGKNLLTIIDDLLDFSKIEEAGPELELRHFSLALLMKNIEDTFRVQAQQKGIDFYADFGGGLPEMVLGDEERLLQIFSNLISNAIKFTNEGRIELHCRHETACLKAEITDSGIGIGPERLDDIFSPFEQIDGSTSRKYGGTGLGLAISKKLVEKMNGSISVQSSPGEGSRFSLSIPLPRKEGAKDEGGGPVAERQKSTAGLDILIAEDNRINQKLMKVMLEKMGHRCRVAADGVEALELLENRDFDLLLLDMHMPKKDGLDVIREIRADEKHADLHVIALTASAMEGDAEKFIAAGCNDYMAKPVNRKELEQKLSARQEH
jgi:PAS domain S-box-containing protein